jgi:hypothetical protein
VSAAPVASRLGYTASPAAYLPAASANGSTVWIDGGSASVYAGQPDASSHRLLVTLAAGDSYPVAGLAEGEVMSVQSDTGFAYRVTPTEPPPPPPGEQGQPSQTATWTCTSTPCPWGNTLSGEALVWPDDAGAIATRLGYTVSPPIYLPATRANGAQIEIDAGSASVFAGSPGDDSHRLLTTITAGQSYDVEGLTTGEVLSVQSDASFGYRAWLPPPSDPDPPADAIQAIPAFWRCNVPECIGADWTGAVINWPAWAAYQSNARSGDQSRSVFAGDDTPLYPYMGVWAQGCQVTAVSGTVLIIEWQRGTDSWRETWLQPGQSHTIDLIPPEDGAMIETDDGMTAFSVTLANCTPAPLAP